MSETAERAAHERFEAEAEAWIDDDPDRHAASLIRRLSKSHRRVEDRISKAVSKAVAEAKAEWERDQTRGDEPTVSEEVFDERDPLEVEAESWLNDNPDHRAGALIKNLRKWGKTAEKRGYQQALDDQAEGRRLESAWRRAEIPLRLRPLFELIDPADEKAIQAKIAELRADGIVWGDAVPPPPPPPVDERLVAQRAMQMAAAGGGTVGSAGDLATRMRDMEANPGKYSQEAIDAIGREYNDAVNAAARQRTSGALG